MQIIDLKNTIELDVDIDIPAISDAPLVTQGDTLEIICTVYKSGDLFDLKDVDIPTLVVSRSDGEVIVTKGVITGDSEITFRLVRSSTHSLGAARYTVQFYDKFLERVSAMFGVFVVMVDASRNFEALPDDEKSIIQQVLGEGKAILDSTYGAVKRLDDLVDDTTHKGEYDANTRYYRNNMVMYYGQSYIAKREALGKLPTDKSYWTLVAKKGDVPAVNMAEDNFIATEGQKVFRLSDDYRQSENATFLWVDGVQQSTPGNYEETSPNTITLAEGVPAGTRIRVRYFRASDPIQDDLHSSVSDIKDNIGDITSQLAQKAAQSYAEATNKRIDELVIESGDANVEVTDAHVSSVKNKTFNTLRNRLEDGEKDLNEFADMKLKNLIVNGDFSQSITGWTSASSTISVSNNTITVKGTGVSAFARALSVTKSIPNGHKVYFKVNRVRVTNSDCTKIELTYLAGHGRVTIDNPVANQWYDIEGKIIEGTQATADNSYALVNVTHHYLNASASLNKTLEMQYVLVVDLTDDLGVGNEPTVEEMADLLKSYNNNWFANTAVGSKMTKVLIKKVNKMEQEMTKVQEVSKDTPDIISLVRAQGDETLIGAPALNTEEADYVNYKIGSRGLKVNVLGNGGHSLSFNYASSPIILPPTSTIGMWIYIEDITKLPGLGLTFYHNAGLTVSSYFSTSRFADMKNGWNLLRWNTTTLTVPNVFEHVIHRIRINGGSTGATNYTIGHIWAESPPKAQVLFIQDGADADFLVNGYPDLKARNIPVTWALAPGRIGQSGVNHVSEQQIYELSLENNNSMTFHSWQVTPTNDMTEEELKEDCLKTIMWLRQRGYTGGVFRGAFTQNKAPFAHTVRNMFLALPMSSPVTSQIQSFPFTDQYDVRRFALHAYNSDATVLPKLFADLKKYHGTLVIYTHLVTPTGDTFNASRQVFNQFLSLYDTGKSEKWLEGVTFEMLIERSGVSQKPGNMDWVENLFDKEGSYANLKLRE